MTTWGRWSALLTLFLHLLVVGTGPLADARLEAQADRAHAPLHVEDIDAPACDPGHEHEYCLVCRTLQSFDTPVDGSIHLAVAESSHSGSPATCLFLPASPSFSPLGPRGPPSA